MHSDITQILTDLVNRRLPLGQIRFSALAEQHPRTSPCLGITLGTPCEAFFSFFGQITHPAPHVLSIHFGKQQLTIELQRDNVLLQQLQVARERGLFFCKRSPNYRCSLRNKTQQSW